MTNKSIFRICIFASVCCMLATLTSCGNSSKESVYDDIRPTVTDKAQAEDAAKNNSNKKQNVKITDISEWEYIIDEASGSVYINRYIGNAENIVLGSSYTINGKNYNTCIDTKYGPMFNETNASNVKSFKLSGNVSANTIMCMFSGCENMTEVDLKGLDTSAVKDMNYLFYNCKSLKSIDVSSLNTCITRNMSRMFSDCESLENVTLGALNTSNVQNMSAMFKNCTSLKNLDVSEFNTSKATTMASMFEGCTSLENLNVTGFNTKNVEYFMNMFAFDDLAEINGLEDFDFSSCKNVKGMFYTEDSSKRRPDSLLKNAHKKNHAYEYYKDAGV